MVKSHEKKYQNYFCVATITTNNMVKFSQDMNCEEMDTDYSTGKHNGFRLLWGIFKEYIKQNIMTVVLRKTHSHSFVTWRLIKKINHIKKIQGEKLIQTFTFSKLSYAYEVLIKRNVIYCISQTPFYTKRGYNRWVILMYSWWVNFPIN